MTIIIISNFITPHQTSLCERLLSFHGVELFFIECQIIDKTKLPIGWRVLDNKSYVVNHKKYCDQIDFYQKKIVDADIVIIGAAPISIVAERNRQGKLIFLYSERIYKCISEQLKRPLHWLKFHRVYNANPNMFLLCASAFAAEDYQSIGCFKNKTYKWGYFTNIPSEYCSVNTDGNNERPVRMMWCSRFINWKHPELPLLLAKELKNVGYGFQIDMYGTGELLDHFKEYAEKLGVNDCVTFIGTKPNDEIHQAMREHDIFLFTSDKNEGWGVVCNEAMSNGCVVVASHAIGSVPYLIQHRATGVIYESNKLSSLIKQVKWLLDNPKKMTIISRNGYERMKSVWSPQNAAKRLLELSDDIINRGYKDIIDGPCSKASVLKNNWYKD